MHNKGRLVVNDNFLEAARVFDHVTLDVDYWLHKLSELIRFMFRCSSCDDLKAFQNEHLCYIAAEIASAACDKDLLH